MAIRFERTCMMLSFSSYIVCFNYAAKRCAIWGFWSCDEGDDDADRVAPPAKEKSVRVFESTNCNNALIKPNSYIFWFDGQRYAHMPRRDCWIWAGYQNESVYNRRYIHIMSSHHHRHHRNQCVFNQANNEKTYSLTTGEENKLEEEKRRLCVF